jgi:integrase
VVDFNPKLKAQLLDMKARSQNVSQWLFPSPQRGDKDIPAKTFRESLALVPTRAELPAFGFHDCRRHFISMSVMSGINFMTIAAWVGSVVLPEAAHRLDALQAVEALGRAFKQLACPRRTNHLRNKKSFPEGRISQVGLTQSVQTLSNECKHLR